MGSDPQRPSYFDSCVVRDNLIGKESDKEKEKDFGSKFLGQKQEFEIQARGKASSVKVNPNGKGKSKISGFKSEKYEKLEKLRTEIHELKQQHSSNSKMQKLNSFKNDFTKIVNQGSSLTNPNLSYSKDHPLSQSPDLYSHKSSISRKISKKNFTNRKSNAFENNIPHRTTFSNSFFNWNE